MTSKAAGFKTPLQITNMTEANKYSNMSINEKIKHIPIFKVSNKNGINIDLLRDTIVSLEPYNRITGGGDMNLFQIDERYCVTGVGTVVYGVLRRGKMKLTQKLYLGPFNGMYTEVSVNLYIIM